MAQLEFHRQAVWPELAVEVTSVSDQWAGMALAGPKSRAVLARATADVDVGNEALPFMGVMAATIAGCPVRLFRISFSGELAYEIHTAADYGTRVWRGRVRGRPEPGIVTYGTEAMGTLRIEKGHVAGRRARRPDDARGPRPRPAGEPQEGLCRSRGPGPAGPDRSKPARAWSVCWRRTAGRRSVAAPRSSRRPGEPPPVATLGHVTSADFSPTLEQPIALALISGGLERRGETLFALYPLRGRRPR